MTKHADDGWTIRIPAQEPGTVIHFSFTPPPDPDTLPHAGPHTASVESDNCALETMRRQVLFHSKRADAAEEQLFNVRSELTADLAQARLLLKEWADSRPVMHFPIDGTIPGNRVDPAADPAWGCNSCGEGWPCLTIRILSYLDPTS